MDAQVNSIQNKAYLHFASFVLLGIVATILTGCLGGGTSGAATSLTPTTSSSSSGNGTGNGSGNGPGIGSGSNGTGAQIQLLAGVVSGSGLQNGTGSTALFTGPTSTATDGTNIYVADTGNNVIRKITSGGVVTTLAGSGESTSTLGCYGNGTSITCGDGTGTAATFNQPRAITYDAVSGTLYVLDSGSSTIRNVTLAGVVTTFAGSAGSSGHVDGPNARLTLSNFAGSITTDNHGNVWVNSQGLVLLTPTPTGLTPSNATTVVSNFNAPSLPAVTAIPAVPWILTTSAQACAPVVNGGLHNSSAGTCVGGFSSTAIIAFDHSTGNILVLDNAPYSLTSNPAQYPAGTPLVPPTLFSVTPPVITSLAHYANGSTTLTPAVIGTPSVVSDFANPGTIFTNPIGLAVDGSGNVYVTDNYSGTQYLTAGAVLWQITPAGVPTQLAGGTTQGAANGLGAAASFGSAPLGLSVDSSGNIYIADQNNNEIRKVTPSGYVSAFAGLIGTGYADGSVSGARFASIGGIASDTSANIYVADTNNNTIRAITSGGTVTTLAGSAVAPAGSIDAAGAAAAFSGPTSVATDPTGNYLYVADQNNYTVRKIVITPGANYGAVTTYAGQAGVAVTADGSGTTTASFSAPTGIATDAVGNLYVTDSTDSVIRKIDTATTPNVSTFKGTVGITSGGTLGLPCDTVDVTNSATTGCTSETFNKPTGITADTAGNIYVVDSGDNLIRKIDTSGNVTTLAGTFGVAAGTLSNKYCDTVDVANVATTGCTGVTFGGGTSYQGIAVDAAGDVYVSDNVNNVIRKITSAGVVSTVAVQAGSSAGLPVPLTAPTGITIFGTSLFFSSGGAVVYLTSLP